LTYALRQSCAVNPCAPSRCHNNSQQALRGA